MLGASVQQLLLLLNKEVFILSALAFGIGLPLAWYLSHQWLEGFAYRISIGLENISALWWDMFIDCFGNHQLSVVEDGHEQSRRRTAG